jgi:hypothetical protein
MNYTCPLGRNRGPPPYFTGAQLAGQWPGKEVPGSKPRRWGFVEQWWARAEVAAVTVEHVGGRRWRSTGWWPRQPKAVAGSMLRWFLMADSGSAAGLAWCRGPREWCGVVGASALGAEKCSDEGPEEHGESRVEWVAFDGCRGKRRDGFSHGPTAWRGDTWGGGCKCYSWSGRGGRSIVPAWGGGSGRAAIARTTPASGHRLSGAWDWQVGPGNFFI